MATTVRTQIVCAINKLVSALADKTEVRNGYEAEHQEKSLHVLSRRAWNDKSMCGSRRRHNTGGLDDERMDDSKVVRYSGQEVNVTEESTYNGWTNRETWLVALWLGNTDAMTDEYTRYIANDKAYNLNERADILRLSLIHI